MSRAPAWPPLKSFNSWPAEVVTLGVAAALSSPFPALPSSLPALAAIAHRLRRVRCRQRRGLFGRRFGDGFQTHAETLLHAFARRHAHRVCGVAQRAYCHLMLAGRQRQGLVGTAARHAIDQQFGALWCSDELHVGELGFERDVRALHWRPPAPASRCVRRHVAFGEHEQAMALARRDGDFQRCAADEVVVERDARPRRRRIQLQLAIGFLS